MPGVMQLSLLGLPHTALLSCMARILQNSDGPDNLTDLRRRRSLGRRARRVSGLLCVGDLERY